MNLVTKDQWPFLTDSLGESLLSNASGDGPDSADLFELLADAWTYTRRSERTKRKVLSVFGDSRAFKRVEEAYENLSNTQFADVLFLLGEAYLDGDLQVPSRIAPNQPRAQDASETYLSVKKMFGGEDNLETDQVEAIASRVRAAAIVTQWLDAAVSGTGLIYRDDVVRSAMSVDPPPDIPVAKILEQFEYIRDLLGDDFVDFLRRYRSAMNMSAVDKICLDNILLVFIPILLNLQDTGWNSLTNRAEKLLRGVDPGAWSQSLEAGDHKAQLLMQMIDEFNFEFSDSNFYDTVVNLCLDILGGKRDISAKLGPSDRLFNAIPTEFHGDLFRRLRESLRGVSGDSLHRFHTTFPTTIHSVISSGQRMRDVEKDQVARHLLCPTLESGHIETLGMFEALGRSSMADFLKSSTSETREIKDGALTLFIKNSADRGMIKRMTDLIEGKKKAKTIFDYLWPSAE